MEHAEHVERLALARLLARVRFARLHYRATDASGASHWHTEFYAGASIEEAVNRAARAGERRLAGPAQADNVDTARVRTAHPRDVPIERLRELHLRNKKGLLGVPERIEPVAQPYRVPTKPTQGALSWSELKV